MIQQAIVRLVVSQVIDREFSNPSAHLNLDSDLEFDSLHRVELSMALEDEFSIEITDAEAAGWVTVADVEKTVAGKTGWA